VVAPPVRQEPDAAHVVPHDAGAQDVHLLVPRDAHRQVVAGTVRLRAGPGNRAWLVVALTLVECAQAVRAAVEVRPVSSAAVWAVEVLVEQPAQDAWSLALRQPDAESSDAAERARPVASES
jgi:hypothetical protein